MFVPDVVVKLATVGFVPLQKVWGLVAVGAAGAAFTVTFAVPAALVQPLAVIVTEYVPASPVAIFGTDVVLTLSEKPFGPVQLYVTPAPAFGVERFNVCPSQIGFGVAVTVGVAGAAFTVTFADPAALVQPLVVIVTEYVPASPIAIFGTEVVLVLSEKPFGPVQLYVAPATLGVERFNVCPSQIGFGVAVTVGVAGVAFTVIAPLVQVLVPSTAMISS